VSTIVVGVGTLLMFLFYNLTDDKVQQIRKEIGD